MSLIGRVSASVTDLRTTEGFKWTACELTDKDW